MDWGRLQVEEAKGANEPAASLAAALFLSSLLASASTVDPDHLMCLPLHLVRLMPSSGAPFARRLPRFVDCGRE